MAESTYSISEALLTLCDGAKANEQGMSCGEGAGKPWMRTAGSASPHGKGFPCQSIASGSTFQIGQFLFELTCCMFGSCLGM